MLCLKFCYYILSVYCNFFALVIKFQSVCFLAFFKCVIRLLLKIIVVRISEKVDIEKKSLRDPGFYHSNILSCHKPSTSTTVEDKHKHSTVRQEDIEEGFWSGNA